MWRWFHPQGAPREPATAPDNTARPAETLRLFDTDGSNLPRCLITALGAGLPNREALLASVVRRIKGQDKRPVVCATGLSLPFLVDAPVAIELLPCRQDLRVLTDAEYAAYLRRRWDIVLAKWQVEEVIALGAEFDEFLAAELDVKSGPQTETPP
jgi:hypothetical protein